MSGQYTDMFKIPSHSSNRHFVSNPYVPMTCPTSDAVCFSLVDGSLPCTKTVDPAKILLWRSIGELSTLSKK
jgi:hypothetical protein